MSKEIKLTQNKIAIVDDEVFEELSKYKWQCCKGYARRKPKKRENLNNKIILMHCQILGRIDGYEIDHINGNKLDNRKENLRHCTKSQNMANSKSNIGSSKYKGVSWDKNSKKWRARIWKDHIKYYLGLFTNEIEAATEYNKKAFELFGDFALLNIL